MESVAPAAAAAPAEFTASTGSDHPAAQLEPTLQSTWQAAIGAVRAQLENHDLQATLQSEMTESALAALDRFDGVVEEALARLTTPAATPGPVARELCLHLLRRSLKRSWSRRRGSGRSDDLDHLVQQILQVIPDQPQGGRQLGTVLVDQPYLGAAHEQWILELTSRSGERTELIPVASDLLLTLWNNLCAAGARSSRELTHLALLFRTDANRSRRLAALRFLLTEAPRRFRDLALHEVLTTADGDLVAQLTFAAALGATRPRDGITTLLRLSAVSSTQTLPALLELEDRQPGLLSREIERWPREARTDRFYRFLVKAQERSEARKAPAR